MTWTSKFGKHLYALLPAVYRARDNSVHNASGAVVELGDLAKYLDASGEMLDKIEATLNQRLADVFPDNDDPDGAVCQDWVLPYLAALLDVRLVSPTAEGQREEIANAVAWRKGKGSENVAEHIAEAVAQLEVEIQEGWQRVALTPRIGMPLIPATALGEENDIDVETEPASRIANHPGLAAVTVDFRRHSRAIVADETNPAAKETVFGDSDTAIWWRQANRHAAPCFPGSYEDVSRRTVDLRDPNWRQGFYHPKRLLVHYKPEPGFFMSANETISWGDVPSTPELIQYEIIERETDTGTESVRVVRGMTQNPVHITGDKALDEDVIYHFENVCLDNALTIKSPARVELEKCAANQVVVELADESEPVLNAYSCLFHQITALDGLVRLEYCTVLGEAIAKSIQASDCVFLETIRKNSTGPVQYPDQGCIRYSCLPESFTGWHLLYEESCIFLQPTFYSGVYGEYGAGVLHTANPDSLCYGAEDGGEMGAYHEKRYCLGREAVIDKLGDYLPVGISAVLIPDERLLCAPPDTTTS